MSFKTTINKYKTKLNPRIISALIFIFAFGLLGVIYLSFSSAAINPITYEPESGSISGNAEKVAESGASGGEAVVFGLSSQQPEPTPTPPTPGGGIYPIKASSNGRYLLTNDGNYFWYYADTSWHSAARYNQADFITLLDDRKAKGFNTIQISMLMFPNLGPVQNAYGDEPFVGGFDLTKPLEVGSRTSNATSPDYDYWDHIDFIIDQAASRDMQINFVASWYGWGGWDWRGRINNSNATSYGTFLGKRFGDKKNIMWTLGGDNNPDDSGRGGTIRVPNGLDKSDKTQASINMGNAIRNNSSVRHLMSYHTERRFSSSDFFSNQAWHTISYAYSDDLAYEIVLKDYNRSNPLPVINPEAFYDSFNDQRNTINGYPVLSHLELRAQAYWTYLSGGVGFAYGHMNLWDSEPTWRNYLNDKSTKDIQVLISLLENYKLELLPDHRNGNNTKMLSSGYGSSGSNTYAVSAMSRDKSVGLAYFPSGRNITVNMGAFKSGNVTLSWFNPDNGQKQNIGTYSANGTRNINYPGGFSDAVLIAEVK